MSEFIQHTSLKNSLNMRKLIEKYRRYLQYGRDLEASKEL